ncbi:hypothetical protein AVEN_96353-1 [Araneus ventricosus]|uniref:Uncharacterized protein n=1 Tax=Araneus ventricosus TaxID=182803 RepID=A0A4Y2KTT2_ARAVE|nr:hypothetical protein AVEN_96353-1 [Araneus ventricosus]
MVTQWRIMGYRVDTTVEEYRRQQGPVVVKAAHVHLTLHRIKESSESHTNITPQHTPKLGAYTASCWLDKNHTDSWHCPNCKKTLFFPKHIWASHSNEETKIRGCEINPTSRKRVEIPE